MLIWRLFGEEASESVRAAQIAQQAAEMEAARRSDELAAAQRQTAELQEHLLGLRNSNWPLSTPIMAPCEPNWTDPPNKSTL